MPSSAKKVKLRRSRSLSDFVPIPLTAPLRRWHRRRSTDRHRDGGGAWLRATINEALAWLLKTLKKRHEELLALRNANAHRERSFYGASAFLPQNQAETGPFGPRGCSQNPISSGTIADILDVMPLNKHNSYTSV